ncbi:MAG: multiheme c-type cytochrome [Desulfobulbaceae bacterium]|nr:multiheme c-type cytochrome [Desulfobulbaceae bacterium]
MKQWKLIFRLLIIGLFVSGPAWATTEASKDLKNEANIQANVKCINCHLKENLSLVKQWENSPHAAAKEGQVSCFTCHAAEKADETAYMHEGALIKTIMTPRDCAFCHEREVKEMTKSHHATAGEIMASLDNVVGEVICSMEDKADAANGCWQCHGSVITILKDKDGTILRNKVQAPQIDPMTWPNTGMGRINPDGTRGSCMACHSKHSFRASIARQPENCGKCHLGPDHPQMEVYNESKHGIAYNAAIREGGMNGMNILKQGTWILGQDYYTAPTCSTCHMGAFVKLNGSIHPNTHNVGDRISWNLRAPVSVKLNRAFFEDETYTDIPGDIPPQVGQKAAYGSYKVENGKFKKISTDKQVVKVLSWEDRRNTMKEVCKSCHGMQQVDSFYKQFDALVVTYNEKFAKPGQMLWDEMKKDGLVKGSLFHSDAGWAWWEIWHHEGRRARHGAAMMGPDYTHWHGMYEVAHKFYFEYLPEVIRLAEEHGQLEKYQKIVDDLLARPEHQWRKEGFGAEVEKMIKQERKERYGQ